MFNLGLDWNCRFLLSCGGALDVPSLDGGASLPFRLLAQEIDAIANRRGRSFPGFSFMSQK